MVSMTKPGEELEPGDNAVGAVGVAIAVLKWSGILSARASAVLLHNGRLAKVRPMAKRSLSGHIDVATRTAALSVGLFTRILCLCLSSSIFTPPKRPNIPVNTKNLNHTYNIVKI